MRNTTIWKNKVYFVPMKIPEYGAYITNPTSQENSLSKLLVYVYAVIQLRWFREAPTLKMPSEDRDFLPKF